MDVIVELETVVVMVVETVSDTGCKDGEFHAIHPYVHGNGGSFVRRRRVSGWRGPRGG